MNKLLCFLLLFTLISCSDQMDDMDQTPEDIVEETDDSKTFVLWEGDVITFVKSAGGDPTKAENQDEVTASVKLTRGNNGGGIFNISQENTASQNTSPAGTKWAVGSISDASKLSFQTFRSAVGSPKDVVGKNLVMYVEAEDVYVSVKFLEWGANKSGSFAYERSTED